MNVISPLTPFLSPNGEREHAHPTLSAAPRISLESLRGAMLWLTGFAGAFVFVEPSPYELMAIATMLVAAWRCARQ